jgi:hypothetical protein
MGKRSKHISHDNAPIVGRFQPKSLESQESLPQNPARAFRIFKVGDLGGCCQGDSFRSRRRSHSFSEQVATPRQGRRAPRASRWRQRSAVRAHQAWHRPPASAAESIPGRSCDRHSRPRTCREANHPKSFYRRATDSLIIAAVLNGRPAMIRLLRLIVD